MDKARKTEIVDKQISKILVELTKKHDFRVETRSKYSAGRIVIEIKD
ncbi:MAG: hypothetical protein ABF820_08585 [Sporolactobacillus sp.]